MAQVSVTPNGPSSWRVEIDDDSGRQTRHVVRVPSQLMTNLGLDAHREEELVYESFYFLIAREPVTSILPDFSLDLIGQYFPEYEYEMGAALTS